MVNVYNPYYHTDRLTPWNVINVRVILWKMLLARAISKVTTVINTTWDSSSNIILWIMCKTKTRFQIQAGIKERGQEVKWEQLAGDVRGLPRARSNKALGIEIEIDRREWWMPDWQYRQLLVVLTRLVANQTLRYQSPCHRRWSIAGSLRPYEDYTVVCH